MNAAEDLTEKGFQLAYFIFPDRAEAVRILSNALNKLKAQRGRESRRAYWRDKYLKRAITRISREDGDTLQWLIFYESDAPEKVQEALHRAELKHLLLRYIKSLVRMTSAMSSFHVNIGLHRLMNNYSTAEAQQVYEAITDRYLGADEYRRAKSVLMSKLEERFGAMLKTCRTQHGEMRFESADQQEAWSDLVNLCLKEFTPWSTSNACPVPLNFGDPERTLPSRLSGEGASEADQNEIEINRCHAFIDPACYGRLVRALAIEPPSKKLDLPRFYMNTSDSSKHVDGPPQPLSPEERRTIAEFTATQSDRRRKAKPENLFAVVDGKQLAQFDLAGKTSRQFEIAEGAELLEIWTHPEGEPLLLATHRIAYSGAQGIAPAAFSFAIPGGAELALQISGSIDSPDGPRKAIVSLNYIPRPRVVGLAAWIPAAPTFTAASAALIALGWFLAIAVHRQTSTGQPATMQSAQLNVPTPPPSVTAKVQQPTAVYRLISDDLITRGNGASDIPSVAVPQQPALLQLELPVAAEDAGRTFQAGLKPFLKGSEVLIENKLKARTDGSIALVTFWMPSSFLQPNTDYVVDLRYQVGKRNMQGTGSYTFRTIAPKK
ncbi:MAG TPA: hypothetical protein VLA83_02655 [Candidatus Binatia bacterium]|nr:hypothetical protein [Candidatus Binatia bacterium]